MYVISYDITEDKIRNKIAKTLEGYGKRVQYSVFECDITKLQYQELYGKLGILISEDPGASVRFYNICANCRSKLSILGVLESDEYSVDDVIVI